MICMILAAGYATRLYPLTENFPKPLLEVGGKAILDWLLDDIDGACDVSRYVVISNHKYAAHFRDWAKESKLNLTVLDDGSISNETRLGAVRDMQFAIDAITADEDVLVIAGDNVLDFSLGQFVRYAQKAGISCLMRYRETDAGRLKKCGVMEIGKGDRVTRMEEKPEVPFSDWCAPPFYYYVRNDLPRMREAIDAGVNVDAPGSLMAWMAQKTEIRAMEMPGKRYDIGNLESYRAVCAGYRGIEGGKRMTYLVTGAAGFIGFHLSKWLLARGETVVGYDNLNDYYDVRLKEARLDVLHESPEFTFAKGDLADDAAVEAVFAAHAPQIVVNLAAQAGVRYSIDNPRAYIESNIVGFFNVLEACRRHPVKHLLYASSSSVYGNQQKTPFSVTDDVSKPISLYAATKKSNELMAFTYSHLYGIPTTGLRFFTVYGPYGRPDMAYFKFTDMIMRGETIKIYNGGDMLRDFTYVDDIVRGIIGMLNRPPEGPDPAKVYNIGNNKPEKLMRFIGVLEKAIGREAKKEFLPMQPGDVYQTYADVDDLIRDFNFKPETTIEEGLGKFADWYRGFYGEARE